LEEAFFVSLLSGGDRLKLVQSFEQRWVDETLKKIGGTYRLLSPANPPLV